MDFECFWTLSSLTCLLKKNNVDSENAVRSYRLKYQSEEDMHDLLTADMLSNPQPVARRSLEVDIWKTSTPPLQKQGDCLGLKM